MRLKKSHYLALEDAIFDSRIPLRSEEEFRVGITFTAKFVGCGNVPRPNSRMEIVAAMRRIRTDCRTRKDKKRKVIITVSYEGVKVALPSGGKKSTASFVIAQHPIHRIFYVSHDSLDLHIFSYIAREGSVFKCFVFKADKQAMAINVVRTIGQAFELCHKMTFVMNDGAVVNGTGANNHSEQLSEIEDSTKLTAIRTGKRDSLVKDIGHNMEQMIHEVDAKIDKLADKIEVLEKQLAILLSMKLDIPLSPAVESGDESGSVVNAKQDSSGDSDHSSQGIDKNSLFSDLNCFDVSNQERTSLSSTEKIKSNQLLNSPDSLLSSPILLNSNSIGSSLLFNHLY